MQDRVLTITAERTEAKDMDNENTHISERRHGKSSRSLRLPPDANEVSHYTMRHTTFLFINPGTCTRKWRVWSCGGAHRIYLMCAGCDSGPARERGPPSVHRQEGEAREHRSPHPDHSRLPVLQVSTRGRKTRDEQPESGEFVAPYILPNGSIMSVVQSDKGVAQVAYKSTA